MTLIVVCESKVELLFSNSAFLIQKITQAELGSTYVISGAAGRGRTDTVSLPLDFESSTSANSIIPALLYLLYTKMKKNQEFFAFL